MSIKNPNQEFFKYCPDCGKKDLGELKASSFKCRSCGFVFYLNTASATAGMIFNSKQDLLVTQRKYDPKKGYLDLPGGFADPHETLEQCIMREIQEELNLTVTKLSYLASFPNQYEYKDIHYFVIDAAFICHVESLGDMSPQDDVANIIFMSLAELNLDDFAFSSTRKIISHYLNPNVA
ncbi:MAG: NUDIX domain-containing protein [Desulfobacteraceae bacterium]|nr:NUDIX domain-containing protein [Desulfobacteraceae bacterium]